MENMPWDEICALDKILVKDNKYIGSITVIPGYYGIGGSNCIRSSPSSSGSDEGVPKSFVPS